jgi:DNA-binding transcriptional ArsR family regulator
MNSSTQQGFIMVVPLYQAKAEFFRTLGHPARIRVLELLSERDHAVHELLAEIDIEASNLSQQLAVLRRAGLVTQSRVAGEVRYAIGVAEVRDLLMAARTILIGLLDGQLALKTALAGSTTR